jgi:copper resistance protein C
MRWLGWLILLFLLGNLGIAYAHADLVRAKPAVGETLPQPPEQIELTFSTSVATGSIALYDAELTNIPITLQTPSNDTMLVASIDTSLAIGEYSVVWSATATDGHTLSGSYNFAYRPTSPAEASEPLWEKLGFRLAMIGLGVVLGFFILHRKD